MRRTIVFFFAGMFSLALAANAGTKPLSISPEAQALSNDAQFEEMVNMLTSFSANIAVQKSTDALNRYAANNASEADLKLLFGAASVSDKASLKNYFTRIAGLRESVNGKYSFLVNNEQGRQIVKEALIELAVRGKITRVRLPDTDCLAAFMSNMALCYWMYDQCWLNSNNQDNMCVIAVTACISSSFINGQVCFGLFE